jgi:hypothetical protein
VKRTPETKRRTNVNHFALDPEMTDADWEAARKLARWRNPANIPDDAADIMDSVPQFEG